MLLEFLNGIFKGHEKIIKGQRVRETDRRCIEIISNSLHNRYYCAPKFNMKFSAYEKIYKRSVVLLVYRAEFPNITEGGGG